MENIGDWIYLIVIAVVMLTGLVTGKKKKAEQPAPKQVKVNVPPLSEPTKKRVTRSFPIEKPIEPLLADETSRMIDVITDNASVLSENEEPEELGVQVLDGRDIEEVRKAIIYSEILGKRY